MRGNGLKLCQAVVRLNMRRNSFPSRALGQWHRLHRERRGHHRQRCPTAVGMSGRVQWGRAGLGDPRALLQNENTPPPNLKLSFYIYLFFSPLQSSDLPSGKTGPKKGGLAPLILTRGEGREEGPPRCDVIARGPAAPLGCARRPSALPLPPPPSRPRHLLAATVAAEPPLAGHRPGEEAPRRRMVRVVPPPPGRPSSRSRRRRRRRQMARERGVRRGPGWRGGRPRRLLLALLLLLLPAVPGLGPAAAAAAEEKEEDGGAAKECDKPCANGGRCQPGSGQCECQPGWVGDQCQHCGGRFR